MQIKLNLSNGELRGGECAKCKYMPSAYYITICILILPEKTLNCGY